MKDYKVRDELIEMVLDVCGNPNGVSQHGQDLLYETALRAEKDAAQRQGGDVPTSSIDPNAIRVSAYSSDRGSPWVPQMARGVRIIHLPTGTEVVCDSEKSQHLNKHKALAELEDRISCITAQRQGGEAVAYCFVDVDGKPSELCHPPECASSEDSRTIMPLYTAPQPAVPETGWTPCKQWLPAVGERYLCLGHAGKQFICWFDGNSWQREPQGKKVFGVTHWMNLPEPPENNTDD